MATMCPMQLQMDYFNLTTINQTPGTVSLPGHSDQQGAVTEVKMTVTGAQVTVTNRGNLTFVDSNFNPISPVIIPSGTLTFFNLGTSPLFADYIWVIQTTPLSSSSSITETQTGNKIIKINDVQSGFPAPVPVMINGGTLTLPAINPFDAPQSYSIQVNDTSGTQHILLPRWAGVNGASDENVINSYQIIVPNAGVTVSFANVRGVNVGFVDQSGAKLPIPITAPAGMSYVFNVIQLTPLPYPTYEWQFSYSPIDATLGAFPPPAMVDFSTFPDTYILTPGYNAVINTSPTPTLASLGSSSFFSTYLQLQTQSAILSVQWAGITFYDDQAMQNVGTNIQISPNQVVNFEIGPGESVVHFTALGQTGSISLGVNTTTVTNGDVTNHLISSNSFRVGTKVHLNTLTAFKTDSLDVLDVTPGLEDNYIYQQLSSEGDHYRKGNQIDQVVNVQTGTSYTVKRKDRTMALTGPAGNTIFFFPQTELSGTPDSHPGVPAGLTYVITNPTTEAQIIQILPLNLSPSVGNGNPTLQPNQSLNIYTLDKKMGSEVQTYYSIGNPY